MDVSPPGDWHAHAISIGIGIGASCVDKQVNESEYFGAEPEYFQPIQRIILWRPYN